MVMIAQMKDKYKLKEKITEAVIELYSTVAINPKTPFHFFTGKKAALLAGYPSKTLFNLPHSALESFAGVGFHFQTNVIKKGDKVLDIGSGSGTDLLIVARLVGPEGQVVGVDITDAMIKKARKNAEENGIKNISVKKVDAENLPFSNNFFDVVISNGVINLTPDKRKCFTEIYRVIKPGGVLSIADIVLKKSVSEESRQDPKLWAECIVGALPEDEYLNVIKEVGFVSVQVIDSMDGSALFQAENSKEVAQAYGLHTVVIKAKKEGGERHGKYGDS